MLLGILISILAIGLLIVLHELGHYLVAKKFDVKINEFGIGIPPRIYGKKIGETIWSLNWLPIGGFVRMEGEDNIGKTSGEKKDNEKNRSFNSKPVWQRMLIVLAGCFVFWIISFFLFFFIFSIDNSPPISDSQMIDNAKIIVTSIQEDSLADVAGIKRGDIIQKIKVDESYFLVDKISEFQNFIKNNSGQEIFLQIKREENELNTKKIKLQKENPILGVGLQRVASQSFSIFESITKAATKTYGVTVAIVQELLKLIGIISAEEKAPIQVVGPVGIIGIMENKLDLGIFYFLNFLALISIHLAILNLLPIPGLDGGRFVFLSYEAIFKRPFPQKVEIYLTGFFLLLLLFLIFIITIADIRAFF